MNLNVRYISFCLPLRKKERYIYSHKIKSKTAYPQGTTGCFIFITDKEIATLKV